MNYASFSFRDTKIIARTLAGRLQKIKQLPHATVLALKGELGSGKTTFTKELLRGLGTRRRVVSPTFILMKEFPLTGRFQRAFHLDCYRLNRRELKTLGIQNILADPRHLVVIEWPEVARAILPARRITVLFRHGQREQERRIRIVWPAYFNSPHTTQ